MTNLKKQIAEESAELTQQVERIRAQIVQTQADLDDLDDLTTTPQTVEEAHAAVDRYVEDLAQMADLPGKVQYFLQPGYSGHGFLTEQKLAYSQGGPTSTVEIDPGPILAALFPDLLKRSLKAMVTDRAKTLGPGISAADRRQRKLVLEKQLLDLEIAEEQLIVEAESQGIDIPRRADVNPVAVLGLFEDEAA